VGTYYIEQHKTASHLKGLFSEFKAEYDGQVHVERKQLEQLVKDSRNLFQELDSSDIADYLLIMCCHVANSLKELLDGVQK
jgi:Holliday junction resolvasome RuvABC endonuclease subunit